MHGCKFKLKPAAPTEFNNKTELTITDLQKSNSSEDIGQRFNSYIVRAGLYDMAKFEYPSSTVADKVPLEILPE